MSYAFQNNIPVYVQIIESIKSDIVKGKYAPGEKLPSVRELSIIYGANPNTIQKSMFELEAIGLILTDRTNGKYVTKDTQTIEKVKREKIKKIVQEFISNLEGLGIQKDNIIEIIKQEENL